MAWLILPASPREAIRSPWQFRARRCSSFAARELLAYGPEFFTPARKPANTSDADWAKTRKGMEAVARQALATMSLRRSQNAELFRIDNAVTRGIIWYTSPIDSLKAL